MSELLNHLTQLRLEIPPAIQQESWQQSRSFSTPQGRWNAYLNQVCLHTFLPWLQTEYMPEAEGASDTAVTTSSWDFVNGTALTAGAQRLVLIPDKTIDTSELRVPQEWVDIPNWIGDYYLAVQVNPDEPSIWVWGYTTHEQIKLMGSLDAGDRTYCLDAHHLIQDLSVLWVVHQLHADEPTRVSVAPLPPVPASEAENVLRQLANPSITQPRLKLPFELWGALLADKNWLQRLYQLRQNPAESSVSPHQINLSQWLQNVFEQGWQAIETLLGSDEELAFGFRQSIESDRASVKRVKLLPLTDETVLLFVALEPETDGRVSIRVQLRPRDRAVCLPPNLSLTLLLPTGETVQSVQTRSQDNVLQLKRFKSFPGLRFTLQVALDNTAILEDFIL